jgi:hypothetical protein
MLPSWSQTPAVAPSSVPPPQQHPSPLPRRSPRRARSPASPAKACSATRPPSPAPISWASQISPPPRATPASTWSIWPTAAPPATSSPGAYRTGDYYSGKHGRSQRLTGLDPENSNAEPRAIVIHGAWYVSDAMVRQHGKLGRSEGCFAFDETNGSLEEVLTRLGPGRLLYAGRFGIA